MQLLTRLFQRLTIFTLIVVILTLTFQRTPIASSQDVTETPTPAVTATASPTITPSPTQSPTATVPPTSTPLPTAEPSATPSFVPPIIITESYLPATATPQPQVTSAVGIGNPPPTQPILVLSETAEIANNAWQITGDWHRIQTFNSEAHGGEWLWQSVNPANTTYLPSTISILQTRHALNLPASAQISLSYAYQLDLGAGDTATLEISRDGISWTTLDEQTAIQELDWQTNELDLSLYAGHAVYLRFVLESDADATTVGQGWRLDDIEVVAQPASTIVSPTPSAEPPTQIAPSATPITSATPTVDYSSWVLYANPADVANYQVGEWSSFEVPQAIGGNLIASADEGAQVTVQFEGTGIALYYSRGPEGGTLSAQVDNLSPQIAQNYHTDYSHNHLLRFENLPLGLHTLTITSQQGAIWLEAFETDGQILPADNTTRERVTLCHVAGNPDDPANYILLENRPLSILKGHFAEDGTPQQGHLNDFLIPPLPESLQGLNYPLGTGEDCGGQFTITATATLTETLQPTDTPIPTETATFTATATETVTDLPSVTATNNTAIPTTTATQTVTPSPTETVTNVLPATGTIEAILPPNTATPETHDPAVTTPILELWRNGGVVPTNPTDNVMVGTAEGFRLTFVDEYGQPLVGYPVTLNSTGAHEWNLPGTTNAFGRVFFSRTDWTTGIDTIYASIDVGQGVIVDSNTVTVTWIPNPNWTLVLELWYQGISRGDQHDLIIGNPEGYRVSFFDQNNNPLAGYPVTLTLTSSTGGHIWSPPKTSVTTAGGYAWFGNVEWTPGVDTIQASIDIGQDILVSNNVTVNWFKPTINLELMEYDANNQLVSLGTEHYNIVGNNQVLRATLSIGGNFSLDGYWVDLTLTQGSVNAYNISVQTDINGVALFDDPSSPYIGLNEGVDTAQASIDFGPPPIQSNPAIVNWYPQGEIAGTSTIWGRFFGGVTNSFSAQPDDKVLWDQTLSSLVFNPHQGITIAGQTINGITHPFTNITFDVDSNPNGVIPAQGNGYQAFISPYRFNAVFTGEFVVSQPGIVFIKLRTDDGFILGINAGVEHGEAVQRIDGDNIVPPSLSGTYTRFEDFPIVGAYNAGSVGSTERLIVIYFPTVDRYPFEIDYAQGAASGGVFELHTEDLTVPIPPDGTLTIDPVSSPNQPLSNQTGQLQDFTVYAQAPDGSPLTNLPVVLNIEGANTQELYAKTSDLPGEEGLVTFTYKGFNPGIDTVQAVAWGQTVGDPTVPESTVTIYSAEVQVNWIYDPDNIPEGPSPLAQPGCIQSPVNGDVLTEPTDIVLQDGTTIITGSYVDFWPSPDDPTVAPTETTEIPLTLPASGTIASFDPTLLPNGSYIIRVHCVKDMGQGTTEVISSGVMVTVAGEYKPGRVRFTVTDMTIPVSGMPITVGRTYDSLERNQDGDFGYGWSLALGNPKLETDLSHNVTLTMPDGKRTTFYFTPESINSIFGFILIPKYTAQPGVYGKFEAEACGSLVVTGGTYFCFPGNKYGSQVTGYTYTDPYGRIFEFSTDGTLETLEDLNGNVLTFDSTGIQSSDGLGVTFNHDDSEHENRITSITYPGSTAIYVTYEYDTNGDLFKVHYPDDDQEQQVVTEYTYATINSSPHYFVEAKDPRGIPVVTTGYYSDGPHKGRLASVTTPYGDPSSPQFTTSNYEYDYDLRTTTIRDQNLKTVIHQFDEMGNPTKITNELTQVTTMNYDEDLDFTDPEVKPRYNLTSVVNAEGERVEYTYDDDGNRTSYTNGAQQQVIKEITYNQYGGPVTIKDANDTVFTVNYDAKYNLYRVCETDCSGLDILGTYSWDSRGNPENQMNGENETTHFDYDQYGRLWHETNAEGEITTYTYNNMGWLLTETNGETETMSYTYDDLGRTKTFTNGENKTTQYNYDANGNRIEVIDPLLRHTYYEYDAANRVKKVTYPDNTFQTYTYTWRGDIQTITDELGIVTSYDYDVAGQLKSITYAQTTNDETTTYYEYYDSGRLWKETDGEGNVTEYIYDAAGRLKERKDAKLNSAFYEYNAFDQLTAFIDEEGNRTEYEYDSRRRLTFTRYADTTYTENRYDNARRITQFIDESQRVTKYDYDDAGRVTFITQAFGSGNDESVTQREYDDAGRLLFFHDGNGNITAYDYYDDGQLWTITDAELNVTTYNYYDDGQQFQIIDANNQTTTFEYYPRGFLKKVTYPDLTLIQRDYDLAGRLTHQYDELNRLTQYGYDDVGRLTSVTNPENETTAYSYDDNGNLKTVLDAENHTTAYAYDELNRVVRRTYPDSTFDAYMYDNVGNMVTHRLPSNDLNLFGYNDMNRLQTATYYDGRIFTYGYTPTGRRASVLDSDRGITSYGYDNLDRLTSVTQPDLQAISYTYDDASNRKSMTTLAGTTNYWYTARNQISTVIDPLNQTTTLEYDVFGNVEEIAYPNDLTENYTYDNRQRLTDIETLTDTNVTLSKYHYVLNDVGMRTSVIEMDGANGSIGWTYDDADRLLSETRYDSQLNPITQTIWTYDDTGNRLTQDVDGVLTNYSYNNLDQLMSAGTTSYSYNTNGQLTQISDTSGNTNFSYDARGQLDTVTLPDTTVIAYTYDADGRRVQQDVDGTVTNYLWDEASMFGDVVLEYDVNNAPLFSYTLADNRLLSQTQNGDTHFYLRDGQGSVRGLTNTLGSITDTYDYTAFGELYASSEITPNHYRYTGQQFDDLTGLYSLRARYYAPDLGRFLSRDIYPLNQEDPSEWNRYVYVANNATNLVDPTGYFGLAELALILSKNAPVIGATIILGYLLVQQFQLIADALAIDVTLFAKGEHGTLDESDEPVDDKERATVEKLLEEGHNVKTNKEKGHSGSKIADLTVDGELQVEVKKLDPGASDGTIKNAVNEARGQARDVIIDATDSGLTAEQAKKGLIRVYHPDVHMGDFDRIRVWSDNYDWTLDIPDPNGPGWVSPTFSSPSHFYYPPRPNLIPRVD